MRSATRPTPAFPRRIASVVAVLAIVLAACSSQAAGASPVATDKVDLPPSYRFAPAAITIKAGTTVTWTNDDHFTHSVQLLDGGLPTDPHVMEPGQQTTVTFATAGTYHYQCHLHPQNMKGTVIVTG
ncbi:MAG TPA: plastocyanin/azurin family copper-binding protein [Candidatus Limnocylindrales bacterium]|nr:plastocyanin/azurin family copper-binding protein [Candidatus Limnocylindrales bacterium]